MAYANAIAAASPRNVDFIHMPVLLDRDDDAYYAPLAELDLPDTTQVFMGLSTTQTRLVVHAIDSISLWRMPGMISVLRLSAVLAAATLPRSPIYWTSM